MKPQKSPEQIKIFWEKKEQSWRYHSTWLQNILQNYSNQNSMVLAEIDI